MPTREQTKELIIILNTEYDIIPNTKEQLTIKIDTWTKMLEPYSYDQIKQACYQLLSHRVYGKPRISDLLEILNPQKQHENMGVEFANSMIELLIKHGTDNMADKVLEIWGEIGLRIFKSVRWELQHLQNEEVATFKAQLRNLYNSKLERANTGRIIPALDKVQIGTASLGIQEL